MVGGARLAKVGDQGFLPFYCSFKTTCFAKKWGACFDVFDVIDIKIGKISRARQDNCHDLANLALAPPPSTSSYATGTSKFAYKNSTSEKAFGQFSSKKIVHADSLAS